MTVAKLRLKPPSNRSSRRNRGSHLLTLRPLLTKPGMLTGEIIDLERLSVTAPEVLFAATRPVAPG